MKHPRLASDRPAVQRPATTVALLGAYDRLRNGKATVTDGKLSVMNVAREAGFSRATAYRCAELLAKFERARKTDAGKPTGPAQSGNRTLRAAVQQLLSRIIVLEGLLEGREREVVRMRALLKHHVR